jgi:hypothetical protein
LDCAQTTDANTNAAKMIEKGEGFIIADLFRHGS